MSPKRRSIEDIKAEYKKLILSRIRSNVGRSNESRRIAWIEQTLKQVPSGSRILDAGAGEQQFKKFCTHLNYVAQDFGKYDGKGNELGLQTGTWDQRELDIICDISNIPEPNASFDAIMCTEVFEHLPDPLSAIKEFSRLLRKGGCLIITAPFCSLTHFAPFHYYTGFSKYFYELQLYNHGFEILEIEANGNFFEYIAQELMRLSSISDKYSSSDLSLLGKFALRCLLRNLEKFSLDDSGSSEILNFGYHVFARKV